MSLMEVACCHFVAVSCIAIQFNPILITVSKNSNMKGFYDMLSLNCKLVMFILISLSILVSQKTNLDAGLTQRVCC